MLASARVAYQSSLRAYSGHSFRQRHIFDIKKFNLTHLARAFGLYRETVRIKTERPSDSKATTKGK